MRRDEFVARHETIWTALESLLGLADAPEEGPPPDPSELPILYRRTCHHLALARQRHYDAELEARLHRIALAGYHRLYRHRGPSAREVVRFLATELPRTVRRRAGMFWLATVLFYGPGLVMGLLVLENPEAVYALLEPETVRSFEEMYREPPEAAGGPEGDFAAFGFYVLNNVSIAFRTFAGGLALGIGTIFFLVFNGLFLGAVFAHLVHAGVSANLLTFVIAHGAFELTALVIAGVGGLVLGDAIVSPGARRRRDALRAAGPEALRFALGAGALLVLAAFLEAFWSGGADVAPPVKLAVGSACWIAVASYLWLGGRSGP